MSLQSYLPYLSAVFYALNFKIVLTFTFNGCPPPPLSSVVATKTCYDSSEYHCLYNGWSKSNEAFCFNVQKFPPGSYVLYEAGLNSRGCTVDRYQPTIYLSNEFNSKCMYSKTRCSEEGQVVYDSSYAEKDTTCRCDYTRGYDFVTKPKNRCFCIPTEEDCSCYIKQCPENTTLSPDYKCLNTIGLITCPIIKHSKDKPKDDRRVNIEKGIPPTYTTLNSAFQVWFVSGAFAVVVISILIGYIVVAHSQVKSKEPKLVSSTTDVDFNVDKYYLQRKDRDDNRLVYRRSDPTSTEKSLVSKGIDLISPEFEVKDKSIDCADASKRKRGILIKRNGFSKCISALADSRLVLIKGRFGTGKSFMAKQITQSFPDYEMLVMRKEELIDFTNATSECQSRIVILDEVCDIYEDEDGRSKIIKVIENLFRESSNLVIVTVGEYNFAFMESMRKMTLISDDNIIDLDTEFAMTKEEKRHMLNYYIEQCTSNQGDGLTLCSSFLSENVKEEIVSTDTYHGFPLLCKTFCSDLDNIKLGVKYFRQPPQGLIDEIERIRLAASATHKTLRIQYCILLYILFSKDGFVNIHVINFEAMHEFQGFSFSQAFLHTDMIQFLQKRDIPLQRFVKYIGDGKYTMHPTVYQAVLISFVKSDLQFKRCLEMCRFEHVLDLYRMPSYDPLSNEKVLMCKKENVKTISKRMESVSFLDEDSAQKVSKYIVKMQYHSLTEEYLKCVEKEFPSYITSQRVHLMLIIFKELLFETECRHLMNSFLLTAWSILVCTKYEKIYLVSDLINSIDLAGKKINLIALLGTVVDEYNNNMLTYYTLWWRADTEHPFVIAVSNLLSKSTGIFKTGHLFKQTTEEISPTFFAAYLGRHVCLKIFLRLQEKDAEEQKLKKASFNKLRIDTEKLIDLARKGEKKILLDKIKYNSEICPKLEVGIDTDFEKTLVVLEEFKEKIAHRHKDSKE